MHRFVTEPVKLSDGSVLPKGARMVVAGNFMDPAVYPEPETYDPERFLKMRQQPGQENSWQFVTSNPSHTFFGYGQHACPGRFFAANEMKIVLCHLLLKYEWRFVPGEGRPPTQTFEAVNTVNKDAKVQIRRRTPEIDLDNY